jgi:hypothetical protein
MMMMMIWKGFGMKWSLQVEFSEVCNNVKADHTQTWHMSLDCKNLMVLTYSGFYIHDNHVQILHITKGMK